jgi:hypothetical protein
MTVYDEYVKSSGGDPEQEEGAKGEGAKEDQPAGGEAHE